jgi:hypothetical protein
VAAAGLYILKVKPDRRDALLSVEDSLYGPATPSEPVPRFDHSKSAALIVLASFENGCITHMGDGRKGMSAGTDLVRLNMQRLEAIEPAIAFAKLYKNLPKKFLKHLKRVEDNGGILPHKTALAVVAVLEKLDPALGERLKRLSESRARQIHALGPQRQRNLALQKEALSAALEITGISTQQLLEWSPTETTPRSFLDGLTQVRVREDVMLHADLAGIPGWAVMSEAPYVAARTFQSEADASRVVTVVMANRLPLEQQTGADLIYYNETFKSFVLVQYKALEKGERGEAEFRWVAGDQFMSEIARMDALLDELAKIEVGKDPDGFRFNSNPFFLKFCNRIVFNPDDRGMFPGMYLPHGLWKVLAAGTRLKGPQGGNLLTYRNVGRRIRNAEFVMLVGGAWVGTTIQQSAQLEPLIRSVLQTGRTVAFAVRRTPLPHPEEQGGEDYPFDFDDDGGASLEDFLEGTD